MDAKLKELEGQIGKVPLIMRDWAHSDPELKDAVASMDKVIWQDGKLSKQTKKIIAICIAAALRDQHAVRAQAAGACNLGVDYGEVEEALRVTFLLAGMPAYVYGRTAIDDLMKKK
ncbi:MAG: carboxymuconolactone decarboxylase family protein [Methanomicrobiales archaeon]|jgi:alkylhydroperoxidase/carboxymuconolactone decarboxylase family protein YurZ|nr:carboxymuconolactone decarboxylase family protein [Methanomicrobiales archaeon]